ncbi:cobyric acid synthase [Hyphomicrobium facile]|uniref:Cobyric acid synthase n=1 Tax=Hyphomicrobium facile TaxID=51670 RepID=A0A1I7MVW1_9HYPH|nr:cobyric acid synthase [Hyphomicrobium facile]SFV26539.1 adenosylcobyric acid synthase (glutamine-hydrolysing) [Hyphomicrobium facile]
MPARTLMFSGTGSDVGKSLMVAGLCRLLANRGIRVVPFKPQNMSNNAAVTADGGEIGRAQALQARAARVAPSVHMNPVLLKPESETGAQIVVQGKMIGSAKAREFQTKKPELLPAVLESFGRLKAEYDFVLVEGAGSASEINLRKNDIANLGFARAAGVPIVLIGDIDRGGVIASLVGTQRVLEPDDAAMIKGFIVNKMRGDPTLFADGMAAISKMTGWTALGLVPNFDAARKLPAEDALALRDLAKTSKPKGAVKLRIAVPVLPRISNFDDLDPLRNEPGVAVDMIDAGKPIPADADIILLPGSKATIDDLAALRAEGWDIDIKAHVRRGGGVLGLCGGYQMLGKRLSDPNGIEGRPRTVEGLGLLDIETEFGMEKTLAAVEGTLHSNGAPFQGYEMHVGRTGGPDTARPMVTFADGRNDGASSPNGHIAGCYVHGIFASDTARAAILTAFGAETSGNSYEAEIDAILDGFAEHLARHLAIDELLSLAK